jgi:hypothetical protein
MSKSILRYGSARLFASSHKNAGSIDALSLIFDVEFGFSLPRKSNKSIGYSSITKDIISSPKPYISFSYYLSDIDNESYFRIPVTSAQSITLGQPMLSQIEPFDLAFATDEEGSDFNLKKNYSEVSICVIKNVYLENYSMSLDSSGITIVNVSFSGDDILFKTFKNLTEYKILTYDLSDVQATNETDFVINDEIQEPSRNIGGAKIINRVDNFNFSLSIPYIELSDFGQISHQRKINFPVAGSLDLTAWVNPMMEGELRNILCDDVLNDFMITFKRRDCPGLIYNDKAAMLFKGSRLISQKYKQSINNLLKVDLSFDIYTDRNCGIYFTQHIGVSEPFGLEENNNFGILLENGSGGMLMQDAILDMLTSLTKFKDEKACPVPN